MAIRRDRRTSIPGARQECVKAGVGARTRARNRDRCPNPAGPAPRTTPDATQAGGPASGAFQSAMESVPRIIAATSRRHGRCSNARYASTPMSTAGTLSPGRATWTGTVPRRGGDHPRVEHARRQSRRSTRSHVRRGEAGQNLGLVAPSTTLVVRGAVPTASRPIVLRGSVVMAISP